MPMNKDVILVTGGAGYIGGQTVLCLLDAGANVCVLDDLSTGQKRPFHEKTSFYEGKIQDKNLVSTIITEHKIKSILHFAGSIQVAESIENPLKYYENNSDASRLLIETAVENNVERFIFSSTAAVYGEVYGNGTVTEQVEPNPLNPYGWSKLFTERLLADVAATHGLQYGILRYFNVAGADVAGRHGQFLESPVHLIGRAIDAMYGKAPPLQIFGKDLPTPDGTGVRDYIHVCDLASAHLSLLEYLRSTEKNALYNLGYGTGHSVLEVIKCLEKNAGRLVPHEFVARRQGEAPTVVADASQLKLDLNWKGNYDSLQQIIQSALAWVEKCDPCT